IFIFFIFFFFSSRRRHTRFDCDWSSDVCSSDLACKIRENNGPFPLGMSNFAIGVDLGGTNLRISAIEESGRLIETITTGTEVKRSEERRVGKECRYRW